MPIRKIVSYCHRSYKESDSRCFECANTCHGSCEKCLQKINFEKTDQRRYNCPNIVHYYVCKYMYRYSSEFGHLFQKSDAINSLDKYKILSIGAGPSTELYGIVSYFMKNGIAPAIKYIGYDLNAIWSPIQEKTNAFVSEEYKNIKILYRDSDLFSSSSDIVEKKVPNFIILNYVISDMINFGVDVMKFLEDLTAKIIDYLPDNMFIIINDVNLGRNKNEARYYFDIFCTMLRQKYSKVYCDRFHFKNSVRNYTFQYGTLHDSNQLLVSVPQTIQEKFSPWASCASAQIVIHIKEH